MPDQTSDPAPRNPAAAQTLARCRVEFETFGLSFRNLEAKYKVPRSTLNYTANRDGWKKPTRCQPGVAQAAELTAQILNAGLRRDPLGHDVPATSSHPARPAGHRSDQPGEPGLGAAGAPSDRGLVADVLDFPAQRPKLAGPVQLLPDRTPEEKAQLRITLGAIRAMMSVEQSQLLDQHLARLLRYGHLIDVYIEPAKFVPQDPAMSEAERAAKIVAVQQVAKDILLPTDRDTLVGAMKALTASMRETIGLQRTVVGLDKFPAGVFPVPEEPPPLLHEARRSGQVIDLSALDTSVLRQAQRSMEAIEHHQHAVNETPKPPPPSPIDDLMDAPMTIDATRDGP